MGGEFTGDGGYSYPQTDDNGNLTGATVHVGPDGTSRGTTFPGNCESGYYGNGGRHDHTRPIILDLDGDGIEVTFGQQTFFDFDNDGFLEQGSWAGSDDGFLTIELDTNGDRQEGGGDGIIDPARDLGSGPIDFPLAS